MFHPGACHPVGVLGLPDRAARLAGPEPGRRPLTRARPTRARARRVRGGIASFEELPLRAGRSWSLCAAWWGRGGGPGADRFQEPVLFRNRHFSEPVFLHEEPVLSGTGAFQEPVLFRIQCARTHRRKAARGWACRWTCPWWRGRGGRLDRRRCRREPRAWCRAADLPVLAVLAVLPVLPVLAAPGQGERLDAERQVHHLRRMPFGRDQVHHQALGEQQQGPAVTELVGVDVRPYVTVDHGGRSRPAPDVDLYVEVPGVGENRTVAHDRDVRLADHVDRSGRGHEHLAGRGLAIGSTRKPRGGGPVRAGPDRSRSPPITCAPNPRATPRPRRGRSPNRPPPRSCPPAACSWRAGCRRLPRLARPAGVIDHPLDRRVVGRDHREGGCAGWTPRHLRRRRS